MPSWLVWAKYLSITNYAYPVLMNIEFSPTREFACDPVNSAYSTAGASTWRSIRSSSGPEIFLR